MITIDPARLLADLTTLRSFGACGNGVVRPAYSEVDMESRRWLAGRLAEAGLTPHYDPIGNLFGLPPGDAPAILIGSHSDTQPEGGWLDGAFGVMAGLEIARASLECGGPPVAAVSLQDEEGRFVGLTGSRVWLGEVSLQEADDSCDSDGQRLGDLRQAIPELQAGRFLDLGRFRVFFEAHIEQGPVLDTAGEKVGVVEAIVGWRNLPITFSGEQNHAGTTPMALRRDAFQCLVRFSERLNQAFAALATPATVWTIGRVRLHPNAPSIVPGSVEANLQWRDGDAARLDRMKAVALDLAKEVAEERCLEVTLGEVVTLSPSQMDAGLIARLEAAAEELAPKVWRRMSSGALHDAMVFADRMPTAMIFAPSIGGVSHSFAEDTAAADLALCVTVLARAVSQT